MPTPMNYEYNSNTTEENVPTTVHVLHETNNAATGPLIQKSNHVRNYKFSVIPPKEKAAVRDLLSWLSSLPVFGRGSFGTTRVIQGNNLNTLNTHITTIRAYLGHHRTTTVDRWIDVSRLKVPIIVKVQHSTRNISLYRQRALWYNEARIHRDLSHLEFVPTLFANLCTSDTNISIMEFVNGVSLHKIMRDLETKDTTSYDLRLIYHQIQEALRSMWKTGVVHLDFHTNNILVTPANEIKIIDFGMSIQSDIIKQRTKNMGNKNAREFWKSHLEYNIDQYMHNQGYNYYHPNSKVLPYLLRHS